jgi:hypothetical protein
MEDAAALKEQGNERFKAKDFQAAIDAYSKSLELNSNQHLCYSNRSAAYLKLGGCDDKALSDAEKCVELKPDWAKGYRRVLDALFQLKRSEEATALLQKGIKNMEGTDDRDGLEKALKEVPQNVFKHALSGVWHGTVNEVLGGYDQEMEFLDADSVRVEVLGRSIVGRYWVDVGQEPFHLNIQVPCGEVPPGMPPPPPVPYIARIDEVGLHLCCPYLKMERPTEFVGPGYVLMKQGSMTKVDDAEVANLSRKEKYQRCVQELLKVMPSTKLEEPRASDSEDAAGEKLMSQVRFESSMYSVCRLYGEDVVKDVLAACKDKSIPREMESIKEDIAQLTEKLRICGILEEDGPMPSGPVGGSTGSTAAAERPTLAVGTSPAAAQESERGKAAPEPSKKPTPEADDRQSSKSSSEGASSSPCSPAVGGAALAAVALAAVSFMLLSRKQRS